MTSMIRIGDIVRSEARGYGCTVRNRCGHWIVERDEGFGPKEVAEEDGDLIIICSEWPECRDDAGYFDRAGRPLCEGHAEPGAFTVRPDPNSLCLCICGNDLDKAKIRRDWTMGDIICEYRHCDECSSDRAYIAPDIITGKWVNLFNAKGEPVALWDSIVDAMSSIGDPHEGSTLRRGNAILAKVVSLPICKGAIAWRFLAPTKES